MEQEKNKVLGEVTGGDANALFQASILKDNSDPGYCLREVESESERFFAARELTPQALRTVRLLVHGVLTVGGVIGSDSWEAEVAEVLNVSYTTKAFSADPAGFFWAHWQADFAILKELLDINSDECALLLHETMIVGSGIEHEDASKVEAAPTPEELAAQRAADMRKQQRAERHRMIVAELQEELARLERQLAAAEGPQAAEVEQAAQAEQAEQAEPDQAGEDGRRAQHGQEERLAEAIEELREAIAINQYRIDHPEESQEGEQLPEEPKIPALLATSEERLSWESALVKSLGPLLTGEGKAARLREIEARYCDANDEGAVFKDELQERTDVGALNLAVRQKACPGLWRFRRAFSFDHFEASFARDPKLAESFPVLSELLSRQTELSALRHLPQLFRWLEMLMQYNDKRLDREAARRTVRALHTFPSPTHFLIHI